MTQDAGREFAHPRRDRTGRKIEGVGRAGIRLERDDWIIFGSIDDEVAECGIGANLERNFQRRID